MTGAISGFFGGAGAAKDAAAAATAGLEKGIAEQRRQFDITQENLAPYLEAGTGALTQQQALLGLGGDQQAAFDAFAETPGQQFIRNRQEQALLRNASAMGGLGGGNIRAELQRQAAGNAAQDYGNYYNRIANLSGAGQAGATNLGQLGAQTASNIQQGYAGIGQAQASGILGAQQANASLGGQLLGAGLGGIAGAGGFGSNVAGQFGGSGGAGALIGLLSDENMKTDIEDLSPKECFEIVSSLNLKAWRYIEEAGIDQELHFGPMYQDAPECIKLDGYTALNLHDELMLIAGAIQHINTEFKSCLH